MKRIIVEKEDGTVQTYERGLVLGFNSPELDYRQEKSLVDVDLAVHNLCTVEIEEASKILQDYTFKKKSDAFSDIVERLFGKEGNIFER